MHRVNYVLRYRSGLQPKSERTTIACSTAGSKGIDRLCRSVEGPTASSQYCGPHGRQLLAEVYKQFCGKPAICSKLMSTTGSEVCLERKNLPSIYTRRYRSCIGSTVCVRDGQPMCDTFAKSTMAWNAWRDRLPAKYILWHADIVEALMAKHADRCSAMRWRTLPYTVRLPRHFSKSANIRRYLMRTHIRNVCSEVVQRLPAKITGAPYAFAAWVLDLFSIHGQGTVMNMRPATICIRFT